MIFTLSAHLSIATIATRKEMAALEREKTNRSYARKSRVRSSESAFLGFRVFSVSLVCTPQVAATFLVNSACGTTAGWQ